ncbi:MAG: hypothetical protein M1820_002720 [Bogoriella megaspora]|nr:MAG: hypothetical protein M1820_002720 [Bogoriella megaspora]
MSWYHDAVSFCDSRLEVRSSFLTASTSTVGGTNMRMPWFQLAEAYLTARLLASPTFHRAVQALQKRVHRLRHGTPPEEMGGTNVDRSGPGFLDLFKDELRDQLKGGNRKQ